MLVTKVQFLCVVLAVVTPLAAQTGGFGGGLPAYDGPSILGRAGPTTGMRGTESMPIHVQASLNASYDTNLLGYSIDSSGNFNQAKSLGFTAQIGASGRKLWRRSFLGLDYTGDYSHFASQTYFNGSNHQMSLAMGTQIGSRWQIVSQLAGGTSNRFLGGPSVFQASEVEFFSVPTAELFDSRSFFVGNTTSATYMISRRQSVRFSGNASSVRRRARGLADMQAYGASGDWVYRVSRRTSMGVSYGFNHYDFTKIFGETDVHTVGWHVSRRIGRSWDVSGSVTGSKQSTVGVRTVSLDPILAALLGRDTGTEVFESNNLLYGYGAAVSRSIRRSRITINAQRAINPGNGYFLTAINRTVNATVTHSVSRDLSVDANFGYGSMSSLGFAAGNFSGWTGGGGFTHKVTESLGFNARYDWRNMSLSQTDFARTGHRFSIGINYFPQRSLASLF